MYMLLKLIVGLGVRWLYAFGKQREFDVAPLQLCVLQQYLIFQVSQADYSIPHLFFKFLNNKDVKIVGVGMEKSLQKLRDDYDLHVNHALDLGILAAEKFAKPELRKARMNKLVMKLFGEQLLTQRKMMWSRWDRSKLCQDQVTYLSVEAFVCHLMETMD
jgi:hypothetical protein